ncbi:MAG: hypothetical protein ACLRR3_04525 [Eubacterium sp.]
MVTISHSQNVRELLNILCSEKKVRNGKDIYYLSHNNDSKNYRSVFDPGAKLGKKYKYKIVAYYKYVTYKNGRVRNRKAPRKADYISRRLQQAHLN